MPGTLPLPRPHRSEAKVSQPHPTRGQNTGVGSLSLFQGIFLTQELSWGLLHCMWIHYLLSHQGNPEVSFFLSFFFFLIFITSLGNYLSIRCNTLSQEKKNEKMLQPCTGKSSVGGRKLKSQKGKKEKNTIETETTLSWKVAFLNFFNTEEFCLLTLVKVGEEFTETS